MNHVQIMQNASLLEVKCETFFERFHSQESKRFGRVCLHLLLKTANLSSVLPSRNIYVRVIVRASIYQKESPRCFWRYQFLGPNVSVFQSHWIYVTFEDGRELFFHRGEAASSLFRLRIFSAATQCIQELDIAFEDTCLSVCEKFVSQVLGC